MLDNAGTLAMGRSRGHPPPISTGRQAAGLPVRSGHTPITSKDPAIWLTMQRDRPFLPRFPYFLLRCLRGCRLRHLLTLRGLPYKSSRHLHLRACGLASPHLAGTVGPSTTVVKSRALCRASVVAAFPQLRPSPPWIERRYGRVPDNKPCCGAKTPGIGLLTRVPPQPPTPAVHHGAFPGAVRTGWDGSSL